MKQRVTKRINVVLDLDNTLISAIDANEETKMGIEAVTNCQRNLNWIDMEDEYKIFERPYLQEFLTWLFSNFTVSVWTAASKLYAMYIVKNIIIGNHSDRSLDYILFSDHCRESKRACSCQKKLEMLNTTFPMNYDINNTYIIDDNNEVYHGQPDMCIHIKRFDVQNSNCVEDRELLNIQRKLEIIRINSLSDKSLNIF